MHNCNQLPLGYAPYCSGSDVAEACRSRSHAMLPRALGAAVKWGLALRGKGGCSQLGLGTAVK